MPAEEITRPVGARATVCNMSEESHERHPDAARQGADLSELLWEACARTARLGATGLAGTSLTLPSRRVLDTVASEPGITVSRVARRTLKIQQINFGQVASRLEKLGYLQRQPSTGRGVGLHLTPAGRQVHQEGLRRLKVLEQRLKNALGSHRYDCQWPSRSPRWRPSFLPTDGRFFSPVVATKLPTTQDVGWAGGHEALQPGWWLGQGFDPLAGGRLREAVAVGAVGDQDVGVVQQPVNGRGRQCLGHQLVKPRGVDV